MKSIFKKENFTYLVAAIALIAFAISPIQAMFNTSSGQAKKATVGVSDDVVLQWNEIAYGKLPAGPPHPTGRLMATVQLAVFEAVNAITGKYQPYLGTVTAPEGASPEAAAIVAAHDT